MMELGRTRRDTGKPTYLLVLFLSIMVGTRFESMEAKVPYKASFYLARVAKLTVEVLSTLYWASQ